MLANLFLFQVKIFVGMAWLFLQDSLLSKSSNPQHVKGSVVGNGWVLHSAPLKARFPPNQGLQRKIVIVSWFENARCHISQSPSYQTSGYPFISVVMYAVHALIVSPRSRCTPLKRLGEGRSEMEDSQILHTGPKWYQSRCKRLIYRY